MEYILLSRREFAKEVGKSHTWVSDKIKEGYITLEDGKIPKNRGLEELKKHGLSAKKEENDSKFPPLLRSKERYEFYKAEKARIELGILEGKIFYKEDLSILHGGIDKLLNYAKQSNELFSEGYFEVDMKWREEHEGASASSDNDTDNYEEMEAYYRIIEDNPRIKEAEELLERMEKLISNIKSEAKLS